MSKDKYTCIFSRQMLPIVFIILQIFFARIAGKLVSKAFSSVQYFTYLGQGGTMLSTVNQLLQF